MKGFAVIDGVVNGFNFGCESQITDDTLILVFGDGLDLVHAILNQFSVKFCQMVLEKVLSAWTVAFGAKFALYVFEGKKSDFFATCNVHVVEFELLFDEYFVAKFTDLVSDSELGIRYHGKGGLGNWSDNA